MAQLLADVSDVGQALWAAKRQGPCWSGARCYSRGAVAALAGGFLLVAEIPRGEQQRF